MKNLKPIFFAIAILVSASCGMNDKRNDGIGAQTVGIDFSKEGKDYKCLAIVNYIIKDGIEEITDVSAVIIFEKNGPVSPSVTVNSGVTEFEFSGNTYRIFGKNLCLPSRNGDSLEVLPLEPNEDSRASVSSFKEEIMRLIKYVEPKAGKNASRPTA